jgi:4-hydroxybenzoate polyprenyltransferase
MLRILRFFVYSNLYIAACAVIMTLQTYRLLLQSAASQNLLGFIFFATISSYSFHWWLTESVEQTHRVNWLKKYRQLHLVMFAIGLAGSAVFLILLIDHWKWLVISALITFLYSAPKIPHPWFRILRKIAIGKTIFLAVVWTYVTVGFPLLIDEKDWNLTDSLFFISRFFFIYAICILFDYRDRNDDRAAGIKSMVTYFSDKAVTRLFYFSLLVSDILTIILFYYGFTWMQAICLLIPSFIAKVIYTRATRNFSDLLYYFVLDGLMMFSALLMLAFGI